MKKLLLALVVALSFPFVSNAQVAAEIWNYSNCEWRVEVDYVDAPYSCNVTETQEAFLPAGMSSYLLLPSKLSTSVDATVFRVFDIFGTLVATVSVQCGSPFQVTIPGCGPGQGPHLIQCDNRFLAIYP
ncbi:MAG: hypothetical protein ACFB10_07200 [Salibacteraceae bacterium]